MRTSGRLQRKSLTDQERNDMSEAIAKRYLECFVIERPKVVHLFLPIVNLLEVNTMLILEHLNTYYPEVKTVTSIIADDQSTLLTVEVRYDSLMVKNEWGIPEPANRMFCNEKEIDEVLTPLLAVDLKGFRVGYGKGFYDRFFERCSSHVKKTGLNYFKPISELVVHDTWDIALTRLIEPESIILFD